jgi:hypothetical protein
MRMPLLTPKQLDSLRKIDTALPPIAPEKLNAGSAEERNGQSKMTSNCLESDHLGSIPGFLDSRVNNVREMHGRSQNSPRLRHRKRAFSAEERGMVACRPPRGILVHDPGHAPRPTPIRWDRTASPPEAAGEEARWSRGWTIGVAQGSGSEVTGRKDRRKSSCFDRNRSAAVEC